MKNHLQQYLYHFTLILVLAVGGLLSSTEVSAASAVDAEKITLSDFVAEHDAEGAQGSWVETPTKPAALADDLASPAGTNLLKFLSDFDGTLTPAVYANRLSAWEGLFDLPPSVRTDVFNLETVSRHFDETGKLADDVASEIAQSGSYNKWLSDHFVTYIRNGFRLDKTSIDFQFANHLDKVEDVTSNL